MPKNGTAQIQNTRTVELVVLEQTVCRRQSFSRIPPDGWSVGGEPSRPTTGRGTATGTTGRLRRPEPWPGTGDGWTD